MNQLFAHVAAAMLTCGVMFRLGFRPNAVADPTLKDPGIVADTSTAWELHRSFYAAVVGATGDTKNWPVPAESKPAAPVHVTPVTPVAAVTPGPLPIGPLVNAVASTVAAITGG